MEKNCQKYHRCGCTKPKDERYNGYSNYETWNVALWIDNDQGSQESVLEMAAELMTEAHINSLTGKDQTQYDLSKQLQGYIEESMPDLGASMFSDLLNASLSQVNWYELAGNYIENVRENQKTEAV